MKYIAPDFEVVQLQVSSLFASYDPEAGCPADESISYTVPCTSADPNYIYSIFTDKGWDYGCYSTSNP